MAPVPDDLVTIDCSKEGRIFKMRLQNVDRKRWHYGRLHAFKCTPPGVFQRGIGRTETAVFETARLEHAACHDSESGAAEQRHRMRTPAAYPVIQIVSKTSSERHQQGASSIASNVECVEAPAIDGKILPEVLRTQFTSQLVKTGHRTFCSSFIGPFGPRQTRLRPSNSLLRRREWVNIVSV